MKTLLYILLFLPSPLFAPMRKITDADIQRIYATQDINSQIAGIADILVPEKTDKEHLRLLRQRAKEYDIPERILYRLVYMESRYNPKARSPKRANGYCQLMPGTYKIYYKAKQTPELNVITGTKHLASLHEYFGRWDLAVAAYNAGKGAVIKYRGIPPFEETQEFVRFIMN